ncbi:hypothetical protein imdm_1840 [gamma proteobacterium IMCC2047]|nr:hypothetical protein imdm_1840 [gamma proteobacterium IMCC2047]
MIKHITASLLISTSLLATQIASAEEVYKHVDENGVPSFSDTKSKNAEKVIVEPVNVQKMPELRNIPSSPHSNTATVDSKTYSRLEISSPADQTTLRNEPTTTLAASIEPGLRAGHLIQFMDNGQPIQPASRDSSLVLNNFERGEHRLNVRIVDKSGKTVQSGNPVTVYVFRATVKPQAPANPKPAN